MQPLSKNDFIRLTGLKDLHAAACLDRYKGCGLTTLAAVVQSRSRIPSTAFVNTDAIVDNCDEINGILTKVYDEVRKRMNETGGDLSKAWSTLNNATVSSSSSAAVAPTASSAAAATAAPAAPTVAAPISFGFGKAAPAPATAAATAAPAAAGPITFGFGKAAPAAGTAAPAPAGFGFGFGKPAAAAAPAPQPVAAPAPKKKEVVYAPPQFFTGAFLDMPNFWEKEVLARCTILNLDKGFVAANGKEKLRERMLKWAAPCMAFYGSEVKYAPITDRDEETARVILRDADRTFFETEHREKFAEFLHSMMIELNTYGQAMAYLAAICSLALTERETAAILRKTATEVLQGHWAAEAVGFASNAWVFEHILAKQQPDMAEHFKVLNFWPDMYLQKILSGLCVHVLPFSLLFDFLDRFFADGLSFLFRFCLAICRVFRSELIGTDHFDTLFSIMKLDNSMVTPDDVRRILAEVDKIDIREYPLQELKSEKYNDKILPRLAKAPKAPEFEPCTLCELNKPTKYSDEMGIACDECAAKHSNAKWEDW